MPLTIVADENMPGLDRLAAFGHLIALPGRGIRREHLRQADVLLVRSVTTVNQALLDHTSVRFVGSATIGTDHVDLDWLASAGVTFHHAPGCNATAVAEYVLQAVVGWLVDQRRAPGGVTVGLVGYGNVGRRLAGLLSRLGLTLHLYDPPLARAGVEVAGGWASLGQVLACDIVTLHVPLTLEGEDATLHLIDADRLAALGPGQLLINSCRGAVVDNNALMAQRADALPSLVLDVWEHEPRVSLALFERTRLGTAHIAGHSVEGKLRGTLMVCRALAAWLGGSVAEQGPAPLPGLYDGDVTDLAGLSGLLRHRYDQHADHARMAEVVSDPAPEQAFDRARKHYPRRHELAGLVVTGKVAPGFVPLLNDLGVQSSPDSASGAPA
jgi:erythronate-4-phosphate dehydrogenase